MGTVFYGHPTRTCQCRHYSWWLVSSWLLGHRRMTDIIHYGHCRWLDFAVSCIGLCLFFIVLSHLWLLFQILTVIASRCLLILISLRQMAYCRFICRGYLGHCWCWRRKYRRILWCLMIRCRHLCCFPRRVCGYSVHGCPTCLSKSHCPTIRHGSRSLDHRIFFQMSQDCKFILEDNSVQKCLMS